MKKDDIKKGDISVEQIIKVVIFIAVLVIVFLGTSYLYGKQISWLGWLPGFNSTKNPTGIYMIRYDTASRGVQSYDGATWEDFEKDAATGKGVFKFDDKILNEGDLINDFEGFYYDEEWRDKNGVNRGPNKQLEGWPSIVGFEQGFNYKGNAGYIVAKQITLDNAANFFARKEKVNYFVYSILGLEERETKQCCPDVLIKPSDYFSNKVGIIDEMKIKIVSDWVLNKKLISPDKTIILTADLIIYLNEMNDLKMPVLKKDSEDSIKLNENYELRKGYVGYHERSKTTDYLYYYSYLYQFYRNNEPIEIWYENIYYGSDSSGLKLDELNIFVANNINYKYQSIVNLVASKKILSDYIVKWRDSIFVKPIGINVPKKGEVSLDKEIKYYCGKLYDGRYIVVDLGIEVKEKDVCGGNLA